jgi:hypothetical protein
VFIDEASCKFREMQMGKGGLMKGQDLASTFSFLRPNDLVWNYVVGNYLKGETPPPFDLLYWNSDSTNLPGPFYAWYLRNTYLENNLVKPGKAHGLRREDRPGQGHLPVYIYGSREDHIVPIGGAYASTQVLPGQEALCHGGLGPHRRRDQPARAKNKRSHWIRADGKLPATLRVACRGHRTCPAAGGPTGPTGSRPRGKQIAAPKTYGKGAKYKAIEPAPGATSRPRPDRSHCRTESPEYLASPVKPAQGEAEENISKGHMEDIVIVSAARTAVGKFGGSLAKTPATELGAIVIREALARAKVGLDQVGEVIMGQVLAAGVGQNPARQAMMKAGVAKETPA